MKRKRKRAFKGVINGVIIQLLVGLWLVLTPEKCPYPLGTDRREFSLELDFNTNLPIALKNGML